MNLNFGEIIADTFKGMRKIWPVWGFVVFLYGLLAIIPGILPLTSIGQSLLEFMGSPFMCIDGCPAGEQFPWWYNSPQYPLLYGGFWILFFLVIGVVLSFFGSIATSLIVVALSKAQKGETISLGVIADESYVYIGRLWVISFVMGSSLSIIGALIGTLLISTNALFSAVICIIPFLLLLAAVLAVAIYIISMPIKITAVVENLELRKAMVFGYNFVKMFSKDFVVLYLISRIPNFALNGFSFFRFYINILVGSPLSDSPNVISVVLQSIGSAMIGSTVTVFTISLFTVGYLNLKNGVLKQISSPVPQAGNQ